MKEHTQTSFRGFSLLELIIVVFIVAMLGGLSRPYLLQSTIAANEKSALTTLRTLLSGEVQYNVRTTTYGSLADLVSTGIVDETLQDGLKSGYDFSTQNISSDHFEAIAVPLVVGRSGHKGFFVDETAVIRFSDTGTAPDGTSPPIQ